MATSLIATPSPWDSAHYGTETYQFAANLPVNDSDDDRDVWNDGLVGLLFED